MKKINTKWAVFMCIVSVGLLFGCTPDSNIKGLGSLPTAKFTAAVGSNGYSVTAVNTGNPAICYWAVPALGINNFGSKMGDSLNVNFPFPGTYQIKMMAVGHGGTDTTSTTVTTTEVDPDACSDTKVLGFLASCTQKTWMFIDSTGAFKVGPGAGDGSWWTPGQTDVDGRPCAINDTWTFICPSPGNGLTYKFNYDNGGDYYEDPYSDGTPYLGPGPTNACHPNSDFLNVMKTFGSGSFTYSVSEGTGAFKLGQITVTGLGAHFGKEGVDNAGGGDHHAPASSITYDIVSMKHTPTGDELVVTINYQSGGWWTFTFKEVL